MSPQGPKRQSAAVYRRRRLVVGALAVVLVLLLWWLISTVVGWMTEDEEPDPAATSEPTAEAGAEDEDAADASEGRDDAGEDAEQESPGEDSEDSEDAAEAEDSEGSEEDLPEGACAPGDVEVTASTGEDAYAPNEAPLLIMEIEHTGSEGCELDVGTDQQEFSVSREGREIFTTAQCGDDGESYEVEMEPGQTERAQLNWPRSDSSEDCTEPAELVPGDYDLVVSLGGITSAPHEFTLQEE